jgi:hypothetical protein
MNRPTARALKQDDMRSPDDRLRRDLFDCQGVMARLQRRAASEWDDARLLGVVTAAPTSELYLPYTVPLILRQSEASGLGLDLVIGLNNGYACPDLIDNLTSLPRVLITHLETTPKASLHAPGLVTDPGGTRVHAIGEPATRHRIFVVHQAAGPWSAGKDVMLLDLVNGFILPNLERGWRAPQATLVFDAEAIFTEHEPDWDLPAALVDARHWLESCAGNPVAAGLAMRAARAPGPPSESRRYDIGSPGLCRLLAEWRSQPLDILGPATRFCAFGAPRVFRGVPVLMPTPSDPISAAHLVYNETCGVLPGCSCMSGAATLARTDVLAGILSIVLARYSDVYAEDAFFTVLAEQAGLRLRLTRDVQFSNRCAALDEHLGTPPGPAWITQLVKWYRGFDQVERLYGTAACASVLGPATSDFLAAGVAIAATRFGADPVGAMAFLQGIAEAGRAFAEIRRIIGGDRDRS